MDISFANLYADHCWVDLDAVLSPDEKVELLEKGKSHFDAFAFEGTGCAVEELTAQTRWERFTKKKVDKINRALVLSADFDGLSLKGVITLCTFGATTVMGTYKLVNGEDFFAVNHNAETRRRIIMERLANVEEIDRFFLVDKSIDMTTDFMSMIVKQSVRKSLKRPEVEPAT